MRVVPVPLFLSTLAAARPAAAVWAATGGRSSARRWALPAALALLAAGGAAGEAVPLERLAISAAESRVATFAGRPALFLRLGSAMVEGLSFTDGIIEFDVALPQERCFAGAVFRAEDDKTAPGSTPTASYESFYLRAHQSGNPDANQYTPVFHGVAGWQLYTGEGFSAPTRYPFGEWIAVRIVVAGSRAEVSVGDLELPAVSIGELGRPVAAGEVGLQVFGPTGAWFSALRVTPQAAPPLRGQPPTPAVAPPGSLLSWSVSDAFPEAELEGRTALGPGEKEARRWTALHAERSGVVNLARVQGIGDGRDTAFARATLRCARAGVKELRFGFSDRVRVYLDGTLLYAGRDGYGSRDYRFLGTIGGHDSVYLPLAAGEHELWLAVSDDGGGWGLLAWFPDPEGLVLAE
jgi:hypothetical protein